MKMGTTKVRLGVFSLGVWLLGSLGVVDAVWAQAEVSFIRSDVGVGSRPESVTVGDFNGDGRLDLATVNSGTDTVAILLGLGDGTFQAPQDFGVPREGPGSITVGHFNGDGRPDLATANSFPFDSVSILLGRGDGTLQDAESFGVGFRPQSITVGDFNGDGRLDVVTGNIEDNTVSILLNNTPVEMAVKIDIKPGSFPNTINLKSHRVIPVAILTTSTFDATTVDPLSVRFSPDGATEAHGKGHIEDVNHDGEPDLVLHFRTQETGIQCGDTAASLTGQTGGGAPIEGSDAI
jgi:FG-GAP-like repeat/FG-GAP repeat